MWCRLLLNQILCILIELLCNVLFYSEYISEILVLKLGHVSHATFVACRLIRRAILLVASLIDREHVDWYSMLGIITSQYRTKTYQGEVSDKKV